jgi:DNA-binding transcriptional regulator GbsR (MarR family)
MDMKRLSTWERKILRRIHGPEAKQETQGRRINQELRELYKDLDIVADIRKKRYEWTGHVVRMNQRMTVKKIFESKLEGSR